MEEQSNKINLLKNNKNEENFFPNLSKIPHPQPSNFILIKNQMKRSIYLKDIKIFFDFKNKKKKEIGDNNNYEEEENKKMKNLIQILKVKINKVDFKNEISNIGCGGNHSFIYDNGFNFFKIFI
jgi:hypothetical protein